MTIAVLPEQISLRPSRRNIPCGWTEVELLDGSNMLVARTRVKSIRPIFKVWLGGFEYLAVEDELDLLWFGKTPAQLDLDPAGDEVPEYRKEPLHDGDAYGGKFL